MKTVGCNVTISHYCHDTKYQLTNSNSHTMYILKNQSNLKLQDIFARLPCQSFTIYKNITLTKAAEFTNIYHHTSYQNLQIKALVLFPSHIFASAMLLYYYRKLQIWHWGILQWCDAQTTYHKNQFTGSKVYWRDSLT